MWLTRDIRRPQSPAAVTGRIHRPPLTRARTARMSGPTAQISRVGPGRLCRSAGVVQTGRSLRPTAVTNSTEIVPKSTLETPKWQFHPRISVELVRAWTRPARAEVATLMDSVTLHSRLWPPNETTGR